MKQVHNKHVRRIQAASSKVGALVDSLSSDEDLLWPGHQWPTMRLDRPLGVGAKGGHGPVRYEVERYEPGCLVLFRFTGPEGFHGHHGFSVETDTPQSSLLKHELTITPRGPAVITWPIFFRPLHDALIEESFDRAELQNGLTPKVAAQRSLWVKFLRWTFSGLS